MKTFRVYILMSFVILMTTSSQVLAQPLDSLLAEAVENHPELKSLELEYQAELARLDQQRRLPNLTIGSGVPLLRPETRLGPQLVMVSASQMFPWFGTFSAKEDVVLKMSKVKFERISALRLELFFEIKRAYFLIEFCNARTQLLQSNIAIFQILENIALANVESGQTITADVFRVQLKIHELSKQIEIVSNEKLIHELKINELTNHSWDREIYITDSMTKFEFLDFDTTILFKKIRDHHPIVAQLDYKMELSESKKDLNKKMNSPHLGVGLDYSLVGERTDANPLNNGRDILIPKISLSLPVYRGAYRAKNKEEDIKIESLEYKKESFIKSVQSQLLALKIEYDNAQIDLNFHEKQIVATALAIEILLTNYSSTGKGFDDLLQLENTLLMHEMEIEKTKLRIRMARAKIERLTDF